MVFPGKGHHFVNFFQVYHSQRLSKTPPRPWMICESGGKVISAHCNCMPGLGESCSHVGAVLFVVEAATRIRDSKTVTQEKACWLLPAAHRQIDICTTFCAKLLSTCEHDINIYYAAVVLS